MTYTLIFDVGSNATKASLATRDDAQIKIIQDWRIETGIGKNLVQNIDEMAIQTQIKAIQTILNHAHQIVGNSPIQTCAIGTEALRKAQNNNAIVSRFLSECGVPLEIISATREAELEKIAVLNARVIHSHPEAPALFIDSGGSSTEFNLLDKHRNTVAAQSFPFGQHAIKYALTNNLIPPIDDMLLEIKAATQRCTPAFVVVAGSSFTSYARHTLQLAQYSDQAIESRNIQPNADVPNDDLKALCGKSLVNAIDACLHMPIFVTTLGIRHGWLYSAQ